MADVLLTEPVGAGEGAHTVVEHDTRGEHHLGVVEEMQPLRAPVPPGTQPKTKDAEMPAGRTIKHGRVSR